MHLRGYAAFLITQGSSVVPQCFSRNYRTSPPTNAIPYIMPLCICGFLTNDDHATSLGFIDFLVTVSLACCSITKT